MKKVSFDNNIHIIIIYNHKHYKLIKHIDSNWNQLIKINFYSRYYLSNYTITLLFSKLFNFYKYLIRI